MRQLWIMAVLVVALGCSTAGLDRSKAKSILESQPWKGEQYVVLSSQEVSCAVTAGLMQPDGPQMYVTTDAGRKLGLSDFLFPRGNQVLAVLPPGFRVSVTVTGLAAESGGPGRTRIEATMGAQIAHSCFPTALPFLDNNRDDQLQLRISGPRQFTFVLFDDGWRVVQ